MSKYQQSANSQPTPRHSSMICVVTRAVRSSADPHAIAMNRIQELGGLAAYAQRTKPEQHRGEVMAALGALVHGPEFRQEALTQLANNTSGDAIANIEELYRARCSGERGNVFI